MIACILIPGFELRAALRERPRLATRAAALAPLPGADPLVGPLTAAAEAAGVRPGLRLGEAVAACPSPGLVEQDPAAAGPGSGGTRAALRERPRLATRAAALAPLPGADPLVGPLTAAAEAAGVRPGMRLGEALAMCPSLELVEQDPAEAEQAWEGIVRRLEDDGFAVEPAGSGCLYLETRGVERLYGGVAGALERALAAVGSSWDPRAGAAERKFAALAAASVARPGRALVVDGERAPDFLAPLPLSLLPLDEARHA